MQTQSKQLATVTEAKLEKQLYGFQRFSGVACGHTVYLIFWNGLKAVAITVVEKIGVRTSCPSVSLTGVSPVRDTDSK